MELPKKGFYRHFKGKRYELIDFATHSESLEPMVVYRALYGEHGLWVRPLSMWSERVERDGQVYTRFLPEAEYLRLHPGEADADEAPERPLQRTQDEAPEGPSQAPPMDAPCAEQPDDASLPDTAATEPSTLRERKLSCLKRVYGYDSFRDGQEEAIDSILSGRDTLAVMPTGAGKSICYQLPALLLDGVALVVSPLISLMKDQVGALLESGVAAAYLNSSLNERQFQLALRNMTAGKYRIVYVAPERLQTQRFQEAVQQMQISLIAVDEAHCISQWGQDFRPSYLKIPEFIESLPVRPRVCAFTATATQRVREDIRALLRLRTPFELVTGFNRPNLYLSVSMSKNKDSELEKLLGSYRGFSGIVYCATRKNVEKVCDALLKRGFPATRYHAGLSDEERRQNQEDFIYDRRGVMVATNAFGMGIDKSNVRFVIHYNMPKDMESYYQEAGRAGRDGERADCHLLFDRQDIVLQRFFIDHMGEEQELPPETLEEVKRAAVKRLNAMANYCKTTQCLRRTILRYFGEDGEADCQYCSNCLNPRSMPDVTEAARSVLACVEECGGAFGRTVIAEILRGSNSERIRSWKLSRKESYGALKALALCNVQYIIDEMIDSGVLAVTEDEFPKLKPGMEAERLMNGDMTLQAYQEAGATRKARVSQEKALPQDVDTGLFNVLKALRMKISKTRSIPPYAVFADAALMDMCRLRPCSLDEMRFVKGVGDYKLEAFGRTFVQAIREYESGKNSDPNEEF